MNYNQYHNYNKNIVCNNCGKYGHTQKQCIDPITSLGIICIKLNEKEKKNCINEFINTINNEDLRNQITELVNKVTVLNKKNYEQIRKYIYDIVNILSYNNKKNYKEIKKHIIEIINLKLTEKQIKKYIDQIDKLSLINNSKIKIDELQTNILLNNTKIEDEINILIETFPYNTKDVKNLINKIIEINNNDNNQINKWIDELVHDEEFDINQNIIIDLVKNIPKIEIENNNIEYLIIRRKHSLGYIEFIRGRYDINNIDTINNLIHQITPDELLCIKTKDFKDIWEEVWKKTSYNKIYLKEMEESMIKFNTLKTNGYFDKELINDYIEPEWGFPKGRRNPNEKNLKCALREFWEETGIVKSKLIVLNKLFPLQEIFYGTNNILYKHVYYIAIYNSDDEIGINHIQEDQLTEIGDIKWKTLNECLNLFRPYHEQKKNVLYSLDTFLQNK
jgi:8-oxo-dGTP pyrophosphatase MutT (NUDIX family)